jgi:hypothetical protein
MTDQPEPILSSPWLTRWRNEVHAQDFTWGQSQLPTAESSQLVITEHQRALLTAPIPQARCVTVRFTLRRMQSHMPQDTESLSRALRYMRLTAPATLARVYSLTRELAPLFSFRKYRDESGLQLLADVGIKVYHVNIVDEEVPPSEDSNPYEIRAQEFLARRDDHKAKESGL